MSSFVKNQYCWHGPSCEYLATGRCLFRHLESETWGKAEERGAEKKDAEKKKKKRAEARRRKAEKKRLELEAEKYDSE